MNALCLDIVNFLALVLGGGLLGIGIWMLSAGTSVYDVLASVDSSLKSGVSLEMLAEVADQQGTLRIVAIVLTAAGCVALVTAVIGIVALVQKSTLLATVYSIAVFLALLGLICSVAFLIFKKPSVQEEVRISLVTNQRKYFVARTSLFNATKKIEQAYTKFFEHMHITYGCCGVEKYDDILNPINKAYHASIGKDPSYTAKMPISCCKLTNKADALEGKPLKLVDGTCPFSTNSSTLYTKPCYSFVKTLMDKFLMPGYITAAVLVVMMTAALVMMTAKCRSGMEDDSDSDSDTDSDSSSD